MWFGRYAFRSIRRGLQCLAAGEGKQSARQVRAAERAVQDLLGHGGLLIVAHRVDQEFDVADDDAKKVVEVVRDAAGELADRLHLLRLAQLRLHPLLARDVLGKGEQQPRPPAQRAQLRQADAGPGDRPGVRDVARLDAEVGTGPAADRIAQQFPVVDVRQLTDGPSGDLFGIGPEHATECRVGLHDALAVVVGQQDAERALLEDAAETLFALLQCAGVRRRQAARCAAGRGASWRR